VDTLRAGTSARTPSETKASRNRNGIEDGLNQKFVLYVNLNKVETPSGVFAVGYRKLMRQPKTKRKETHTMKRTIEIDDTLESRVQSAIKDVKTELENYLNNNPDTDSLPCLNNDLDYDGSIHQIVDSSVPVYTYEIKTAWYLHGSELEQAYENAGVGENPMENNGMAAIYFYIMEKVQEWYHNEAEEIFENWKEGQS